MTALDEKLATTWLRDRASVLRGAATRADSAYLSGGGYLAARYVADKYRQAAALLEDAATAVDADPAVLLPVRALDKQSDPVRCKQCGGTVEAERRHYATPVCFACLPPPAPLPVRP